MAYIPVLFSAEEYAMYKRTVLETYTGEYVFKADPYANYAELRPGTASRLWTSRI